MAADEGALEQEHQRALAAAQHAFSEVAVGEQEDALHELRLGGVCCLVVQQHQLLLSGPLIVGVAGCTGQVAASQSVVRLP